jgi:hypothetical protein
MPGLRLILLAVLALVTTAAQAQLNTGPSMGGPSGRFIGPPTGHAGDFLGVWDMAWEGPLHFKCPCRGSLTISTNSDGDLQGLWKMPGPPATLRGSMGFDQNVWIGRFAQTDDADFPMKGHFRLEFRDHRTLTGSYQPDGTAIPFRWSGSRP